MAERSKRTVFRPRTSILEVPHEFKSRHGSSVLWQGALSSLPSLSEETLKPSQSAPKFSLASENI